MQIFKFFSKKGLLNYLLLPFSFLFFLATIIRKICSKPYKSKIFTLCVGNAQVGGSGKTPTCIEIAKILKTKNLNPIFLTKGYLGKIKQPTLINKNYSFLETGDEALILSKYLPTVVAKNYKEGIKYIENLKNFDCIILDDGFQNPNIIKHYSILVINGSFGFGNNFLLPAGPLRESKNKAIKKCDSIIIQEPIIDNNIVNIAKKYKKPTYLASIEANIKINNNSNYYAFSSIAMPNKFIATLKKIKTNIVGQKFFKDHYLYTEKDIKNLFFLAKNKNAKLITTEKDIVKIPSKYSKDIKTVYINLYIQNINNLIKDILNKYNQ